MKQIEALPILEFVHFDQLGAVNEGSRYMYQEVVAKAPVLVINNAAVDQDTQEVDKCCVVPIRVTGLASVDNHDQP